MMVSHDPAVVPPPINAIDPYRNLRDDIEDLRGFIQGIVGKPKPETDQKEAASWGSDQTAMLFMVGAVLLFVLVSKSK